MFSDYEEDYFDAYDDDFYCSGCEGEENKLDACHELFQGVMSVLYCKGCFDAVQLEGYIERLCDILNLPFPQGELQIKNAKEELPYLAPWFDFTKKHLKRDQVL